MPAKLSVHVPGEAVIVRVLADDSGIVIGRDPACAVAIAHDSVSRRHAELCSAGPGTWSLTDLGSKNGIRVDGERVAAAELSGSRWFAVGDVFCEFECVDAAGVEHLAMRAAERRSSSMAWTRRLQADVRGDSLIADLLRGIVDIAECRRGFLLVPDAQSQMRVRACYALQPDEVGRSAFSGSRSAVERTIQHRRAVFLSDQRDRAWLQGQASVIARDIRALACLPLQQDGRLLGVAYADTDDEAKVFTDLDAELLEAFVGHAAAALAASELDVTLAGMAALLAVDEAGAAHSTGAAPYWAPAAARSDQRA
ncbi:MAG TPA: FHA domain-containing protein [Dokdonella sp.]